MTSNGIVQKLWNYCNVLRDDGLSYGDYVEQLTYLLFLKMADEQSKPPFNRPAIIPQALGSDYATPVGTPVLAVADGTVVVADDLFFEGNAVFIDHGDGLVSMCFHLTEIKVQAGQEVKKGQTLGRGGSTGRGTGPHLFFGVRWHDARINPQFLLEDSRKIPTVKPSVTTN